MSVLSVRQVAAVIDHTFLQTEKEGVSSLEQISKVETLVLQGHELGAYAVCVREAQVSWAKSCIRRLQSSLKVASVIGFPIGDDFTTQEKIDLLNEARINGADEYDMVIPYRAFMQNFRDDCLYKDVYKVSIAAGNQMLKVIFETAYLTTQQKEVAFKIVKQALLDSTQGNPDWRSLRMFKTSTGFASVEPGQAVGATLQDVALMYKFTSDIFGIKPAGGVSTLAQAEDFFMAAGSPRLPNGDIDPNKFRIGTSSLLLNLYNRRGQGKY